MKTRRKIVRIISFNYKKPMTEEENREFEEWKEKERNKSPEIKLKELITSEALTFRNKEKFEKALEKIKMKEKIKDPYFSYADLPERKENLEKCIKRLERTLAYIRVKKAELEKEIKF